MHKKKAGFPAVERIYFFFLIFRYIGPITYLINIVNGMRGKQRIVLDMPSKRVTAWSPYSEDTKASTASATHALMKPIANINIFLSPFVRGVPLVSVYIIS